MLTCFFFFFFFPPSNGYLSRISPILLFFLFFFPPRELSFIFFFFFGETKEAIQTFKRYRYVFSQFCPFDSKEEWFSRKRKSRGFRFSSLFDRGKEIFGVNWGKLGGGGSIEGNGNGMDSHSSLCVPRGVWVASGEARRFDRFEAVAPKFYNF